MEALVTIYPNLDIELSKRHHVKILNYSQGSTVIVIEGDGKNVRKAHQEIEKLISRFTTTDIQFEHSVLLLESARKRIKEGGFKVSINAPICTGASKREPICLTVSSFLPQQLERVTAILKRNPTYKSLKIPGDVVIDSASLKRIPAVISNEYQVSVRCKYKSGMCTSLLICGFVKNDVTDVCAVLKEILLTFGHNHNLKQSSDHHLQAKPSSKHHHSSADETQINSSEQCVKVQWIFDRESRPKVHISLSAHMTYYMQKKTEWFTEVTKHCTPIKVPGKISLSSAKDIKSIHTYIIEGRIVIIRKVIEEVKSLAQELCVEVNRLTLPTESIRLMQLRWMQFKEENESTNNVYIDFTIKSPSYSSISEKKAQSTVVFTIFGCSADKVSKVRQQLQEEENGSELPVKEVIFSEPQFMKLRLLIAKEQLKLDDKYLVIMKVIPESKSLTLKAPSRQILDLAYKYLMSSLESQSVTAVSSIHMAVEHKQPSQPSVSSQPIQPSQSSQSTIIDSPQHNSLCFEAHYIPLLLSQNFGAVASEMEKEYGIQIFSTSTREMNNIVKQVIFRSSSSHSITVQLCYCNLVYEQVDAIVNCSRELSREIRAIGGEVLQLELDYFIASHQVEAATCVSACLESGSLPCKRIIHAISLLESETEEQTCLIQNALECAQKDHLRTISFPSTSADLSYAEQLVNDIKMFFIQNPSSCVHVVRIVCNSGKLLNPYCSVTEFNHKELIIDLPKVLPSSGSTLHADYQWYWQADDNTFVPYTKAINTALNSEYKICHTGRCCNFQVGSNLYTANFEKMEQINTSTHFVRKMKVENVSRKKLTGATSSDKGGFIVNVKWLYYDEGQEPNPYSTANSIIIENLYFSLSQSPIFSQGSKQFSLDFKAMKKKVLQLDLPNEAVCIERKVLVIQPTSQHSRSTPKWYYMGDTKQFVSYSSQDSVTIEGMCQNQTAGTLSVQSRVYTFDFNNMKQINTATGYKRSIKRVLESTTDTSIACPETVPHHHICRGVVVNIEGPPASLRKAKDELEAKVKSMLCTNELPLPSTVSSSSYSQKRIMNVAKKHNVMCSFSRRRTSTAHATATNGESEVLKLSGAENLIQIAIKEIMEEIVSGNKGSSAATVVHEIPAEWQPQTKNTQLFELLESSDEYCHIKSMFQLTMADSVIVSIKRIQNNWLWERYVLTKKRLNKKNNGRVNEKELFHGSRSSRAHTIYDSEEGFDMRYSSEGMWGQANYFAVKASYSNAYAFQLSDGTREILLAKVLTGDSYKCSSDRTLRMPPLKDGQTHFQQERYDTVEGDTSGSKVYMTYSNDKAYPAYLIVYNPNLNRYGGMRQPLPSHGQHAAAQSFATTAPWSYNLTTSTGHVPAQSATGAHGASPSVRPGTNYQTRSHRPTVSPSSAHRTTTPQSHQTTSDQKVCILQ